MEIKITGTPKEVTDFMLALTKSAEIELPLINDVKNIEKQFNKIKQPIYSPTAEAERSQK